MNDRRRNPARLLAPLALGVCALAFFAIVLGSGDDGDGDGGQSPAAERTSPERTRAPEQRPPSRTTYTVQTGDTLGAIAEQTGVSVERLQEMNPELDPQALVAGQKIKLRE